MSTEKQPTREKGWTPIPNWVIAHPDLGRIDMAVYVCLAYHADSKTGTCWPSVPRIMAELKIGNRQTVNTSLRRLAEVGAIEIYERTGYANLYYLPDRAPRPDIADRQQD